MVRLIATKRNSLESRLIRWGTDSGSSHFAAVFYEDSVPIVMQSNFLGVDFQSAKMFFSQAEVVQQINYKMTQKEEDEIFDSIVESMVGEGYDFGALAFFAKCVVEKKAFNIPFPEKNEWAQSDKAICVEMAYSFPDSIISKKIKNMDLSMVYPEQLIGMIVKEMGQ